jgi:biopolymer transport protein ExbB
MGPLALMSLLTVYILIERVMAIRSAQRLDPDFMNKVRDYVHEGKLDSAKNLCANSRSPIARMIEKGISRIGSPTRDIEHAMESVGKLEIAQMERGVGMLSLFAKLAPLFGFIGTIVGVIKIFYEIALADNISIGNHRRRPISENGQLGLGSYSRHRRLHRLLGHQHLGGPCGHQDGPHRPTVP